MKSFSFCIATLLCGLISTTLPAAASEETLPAGAWQPIPTEPLEKYDMPPAYIYRLEIGPRMISQYATFTSYQVNLDQNGNNIVGDAANEPSITVDPTNSSRMTIGWRQFNTVSSNFRQGGWGYTTDGGLHWVFPGVLEPGVFRSDPVLYSNEIGTFSYLSLLETFCDNIYRSTDGGQSWLRLQPDGAGGGGDKQWLTIDRTNGTGHGFHYQAWSPAASCSSGLFSRSTDGGTIWQSPLSLPNSAHWGTLDVASNGNLFIGGGNGGSSFWCIRSSNAQNPAVTPTFDQVTTVNLGGGLVGGNVNPGGLTGQIFLWVDRSGGSTNNNIYMLASVRPPGYSNGTDVMLARSTNGGASFSAPVRINDDATTNKWHWFGTFSVAPNGRLDAVWFDTRNDTGNLLSQLFYSYSTDGGVSWAPNVAVSEAFNPTQGWPQQNKIGDYITIVSDNTGGNVAYSATFNFNPMNNQHEQDVYYVRVSPSGVATPTPTITPTASPAATATATPSATTTVTPTATPRVSQITVKNANCTQFRSGTAQTLSSVSYIVDSHGLMKNAQPDSFLYWVAVTVPAGNNTFTVTETITTGNFNTLFAIGGSNVYSSSCGSVHRTVTQSGGTVTVTLAAPAAGTYFIQLKFNANSVNNKPAPNPSSVHYQFMTTGVPDSTQGIDLVRR